ncbi:MAG: hypothetical protein M3467_04130, partial [Actinomycetota bacterium]|nr:hypothetical protein [Actinomycetota bacterium]
MLVELLQAATTTPDDVFFAVCTGWGDVPPQRFPGAALIDAPGREHFLLRGPLPGALVPVAVSGDRPSAACGGLPTGRGSSPPRSTSSGHS